MNNENDNIEGKRESENEKERKMGRQKFQGELRKKSFSINFDAGILLIDFVVFPLSPNMPKNRFFFLYLITSNVPRIVRVRYNKRTIHRT